MNLSDTLKAMGMRDAFDDNADLSGMSPSALQVSRVQQQVYFEGQREGHDGSCRDRGRWRSRGGSSKPPHDLDNH